MLFRSSAECRLYISFLIEHVSCMTAILPRVTLAALRTIESTAAIRAIEKKKRPVADPSQYELRRLRKGPWLTARVDVEIVPS